MATLLFAIISTLFLSINAENNRCGSAGNWDLSFLRGVMSWYYDINAPPGTSPLEIAYCGAVREPCGHGKCANNSYCCGVCQRSIGKDGSDRSVCLGVFNQILVNEDKTVTLEYTGGDAVAGQPGQTRSVLINVTCDRLQTMESPRKFVQPTVAPYIYTLDLLTLEVCPTAYCRNFSTCGNCSFYRDCEWCLETNTCVQREEACGNWIQNPSACPICTGNSCGDCLSHPSPNACQWCVGDGCAPFGSKCSQKGRIVDERYCPLSWW